MIELAHVMFAVMVFCVVVWPVLTYLADATRWGWYRSTKFRVKHQGKGESK